MVLWVDKGLASNFRLCCALLYACHQTIVEQHNALLTWTAEVSNPLLMFLFDYNIALLLPMELAEYIHYTVAALFITIRAYFNNFMDSPPLFFRTAPLRRSN